MSVRIRMKKLGRKHLPFYRICAMDAREPRNGRVLEELGTYDPMIPETDARVVLDHERVSFWIGKGALPTEKVAVLLKKYGPNGTHLEKQKAATAAVAQKRSRPAPAPRVARQPQAAAVEDNAQAEDNPSPAAE